MFAAFKAFVVLALVLAGVLYGVLGNVGAPYLANVTLFLIWSHSLSVVAYTLCNGKITGATVPEMLVRALMSWTIVLILASNGWFLTAGVLLAGYLFGVAARIQDLAIRILAKRFKKALANAIIESNNREAKRKAEAEKRAADEEVDQSPYPAASLYVPPSVI